MSAGHLKVAKETHLFLERRVLGRVIGYVKVFYRRREHDAYLTPRRLTRIIHTHQLLVNAQVNRLIPFLQLIHPRALPLAPTPKPEPIPSSAGHDEIIIIILCQHALLLPDPGLPILEFLIIVPRILRLCLLLAFPGASFRLGVGEVDVLEFIFSVAVEDSVVLECQDDFFAFLERVFSVRDLESR